MIDVGPGSWCRCRRPGSSISSVRATTPVRMSSSLAPGVPDRLSPDLSHGVTYADSMAAPRPPDPPMSARTADGRPSSGSAAAVSARRGAPSMSRPRPARVAPSPLPSSPPPSRSARSRSSRRGRPRRASAEFDRVLGGGVVPGAVFAARGRARRRQVDTAPRGRRPLGAGRSAHALRVGRGVGRAGATSRRAHGSHRRQSSTSRPRPISARAHRRRHGQARTAHHRLGADDPAAR